MYFLLSIRGMIINRLLEIHNYKDPSPKKTTATSKSESNCANYRCFSKIKNNTRLRHATELRSWDSFQFPLFRNNLFQFHIYIYGVVSICLLAPRWENIISLGIPSNKLGNQGASSVLLVHHIGNLKNVHKVCAGSKSQTREEVSIKYLYKY